MKTANFHIETTVNFVALHKVDSSTKRFYANKPDEYTLIVMGTGSFQFSINDRAKSLSRGEVYLSMPGDLLEISFRGAGEVSMITFQYRELPEEACQGKTPIIFPKKAYIDDDKFYDVLEDIKEEVKYDIFSYKPRLNILLAHLLLVLCRYCKHRDLQEKGEISYNRSSAYVRKIIDFLECNFQRDISSAIIEEQIGLNYDYANTIFKQSVGMTIMKYLDSLRIRTAKDLLLHTNLKISEIAQMTGIPDCQYFSKKFSAQVGLPPLKYRQTSEAAG